MLGLSLALLALASAQAPVQPDAVAIPALRLHVWVSEELPPDALRPLAREGVVLWMSTRSNFIRESLAENLRRFGEAYVQVRGPLLEAHAQQLRRAPGAGIWVEAGELPLSGLGRLGGRRVAVRVRGPLTEELVSKISSLRPHRVDWSPSAGGPSLLEWSRFLALPGSKLVRWGGGEPPERCAFALTPRGKVATALSSATLARGLPLALDCGLRAHVQVTTALSEEVLRELYVRAPDAELALAIDDDERKARQVRQFLQAILGPPRRR